MKFNSSEIMRASNKIVWIVDGKINDVEGFKGVVNDVVEMARNEFDTKTYWWSMSGDKSHFSDLDIYDNSAAALKHIGHWAKHSAEFETYAESKRLLILGEVEQPIKDALAAMNPQYMSYFGGFAKDKPLETDFSSDVIWSFEGRITDKEMFVEAMERLSPIALTESGCMLYWWCCDQEDRFMVLEHYLDSDAAVAHMKASAGFGKLFFGSTDIDKFTIYSDITHELADVVAELNPVQMSLVAGFSR